MPRNYNRYQYETSPRKIEPEYAPKKNIYKGKKSTAKKTNKKVSKQQVKKEAKKQRKMVMYLILGFGILFAMCYQNAQIDENFENMQSLKKELEAVEKENSQLELAIESNLNLSNIEQQAKELLGMQKLSSKQIVYVNLEKNDHIEAAAEKVNIKDENIFNKTGKLLKGLFK